jgi:RHS repeat-associated protein
VLTGLDRLKNVDYTFNVAMPNPPLGQSAIYTENSEQNTYDYDAVGNRINETRRTQIRTVTLRTDANGTSPSEQVSGSPVLATTATFNELNELTTLNEPNGISNFSYDNNGNLSQISKNDSVISKYEYDVRNQLTSAKDGANNELARFDYDFERKRISKTSANVTTNYTYAGSQVVNEYQGASLTATYGIGAGEVVKSEFSNGENNFHYTDALGSVTAVANTANGTLTRNEYNAFGELFPSGNGSNNSIGYTGQRLDNETGLMALGNGERYYSPQYARFIQQDSVVGNAMTPQSLNRFAYAHNNPNKYTDPTGHYIESAWDLFSLGVGIYSFQSNIREGNYWSAALDGVGILADTAALLLPVPGGVGAAIKAYRAVDKVVTVIQGIDRAVNTGQAVYNAGQAFGDGDIKSGLLNTGFALLGAKSTSVSVNELGKLNKVSGEVGDINKVADDIAGTGNAAQKSADNATEILNAKNDPKSLSGIIQKEAKAQKTEMLEGIKARDNNVTDYSELAKKKVAESKAKGSEEITTFSSGQKIDLSGKTVGFNTKTYDKSKGYVYMLRDKTTGNFLKVGKTSGGTNIYERFNKYRRKAIERGEKIEVEFWEVENSRKALDLETQIRKNLKDSGFSLDWDKAIKEHKTVDWLGLPWERKVNTPFEVQK